MLCSIMVLLLVLLDIYTADALNAPPLATVTLYLVPSGDFNINYIDEYEMIDNFANNLLLEFKFNKSNHVVDYIFYSSNNDFYLRENSFSDYDTLKYLSDHMPVFINLDIK